jgi:16S rRNA (guanine527-N7)-methyltransferase
MTTAVTDHAIEATLRPYGVATTPALRDAIRAYVELLLRWNQKIALTTITDPMEIVRLHFGESMFAVNDVPIRHGRLADVGTGAGFPAIPIRMAVPELECVLIESNQKKATFLAEVVRTLKLDRIQIFRGRMETYPISAQKFDFALSRALGMHQAFLDWSASQLNSNGSVIYWIGDEDGAKIAKNTEWNWRALSRIPDSKNRSLLIGSKNRSDHE